MMEGKEEIFENLKKNEKRVLDLLKKDLRINERESKKGMFSSTTIRSIIRRELNDVQKELNGLKGLLPELKKLRDAQKIRTELQGIASSVLKLHRGLEERKKILEKEKDPKENLGKLIGEDKKKIKGLIEEAKKGIRETKKVKKECLPGKAVNLKVGLAIAFIVLFALVINLIGTNLYGKDESIYSVPPYNVQMPQIYSAYKDKLDENWDEGLKIGSMNLEDKKKEIVEIIKDSLKEKGVKVTKGILSTEDLIDILAVNTANEDSPEAGYILAMRAAMVLEPLEFMKQNKISEGHVKWNGEKGIYEIIK